MAFGEPLVSTKITATLTYNETDNDLNDFSLYLVSPCCRVNKLTVECNMTADSDKAVVPITYDYKKRVLNISENLPLGEYQLYVYKYGGDSFFAAKPIVEVSIETENGTEPITYTVDGVCYLLQLNKQ